MKIDALTRLFNLNSQSYKAQTETDALNRTTERMSSEAVKVRSDFGKAQVEPTESERQEKIASLRKQIADGTYAPNSRDVATALAEELFA